jgi:hypothetical protein
MTAALRALGVNVELGDDDDVVGLLLLSRH